MIALVRARRPRSRPRSGNAVSLAVAVAVLVTAAGCPEEPELPEPLVPADYRERTTEVRNCRFSVEHSGVYIRVLADDRALPGYEEGIYPFPPDALVIKEQYRDSACSMLEGFTVMQRLPDGEDPDALDWQWQELDAERVPIGPEDVQTCVGCHRSCTEGRDGTCTNP